MSSGRTTVRAATALVCVSLASGCSAATLKLRDGSTMRGRIIGADQTSVTVEQDGQPVDVDRVEIVEVGHPGKAEVIVGGVFLGLANMSALGAATCEDRPSEGGLRLFDDSEPTRRDSAGGFNPVGCSQALAVLAGIFAVPGLILSIDGLSTWKGSRSRYEQTSGTRPTPKRWPSPPASWPPDATLGAPPPPPDAASPATPSPWCQLRGCPSDAPTR